MPVVGFLSSGVARRLDAPRGCVPAGPEEAGFVEGQNVAIEFRWAEGHYDRLPTLAAIWCAARWRSSSRLRRSGARRKGDDQQRSRSSSRSGATRSLTAWSPASIGRRQRHRRLHRGRSGRKRLDLLRELVPTADLRSPCWSTRLIRTGGDPAKRCAGGGALNRAADPYRKRSNERDLEAAFTALVAARPGAFFVGTDPILF